MVVNLGAGTILDIASILVFGYAFYQVVLMAHEGYGKRFTSVYPYLAGSILLFLLLGVAEFVHYQLVVLQGKTVSTMFLSILNTLQLFGGLLLAVSIHKIFEINYATTGFMGMDDE